MALEALATEDRVERVRVDITISYGDVDALQRLMEDSDVVVEDEEYGTDARYTCGVPAAMLEDFARKVRDVTRGSCVIEAAVP